MYTLALRALVPDMPTLECAFQIAPVASLSPTSPPADTCVIDKLPLASAFWTSPLLQPTNAPAYEIFSESALIFALSNAILRTVPRDLAMRPTQGIRLTLRRKLMIV